MRNLVIAAALLALPAAAPAANVLSDGFQAEPAAATGASAYTGFRNFDVIGTVDLLAPGPLCTTTCVDLAGTGAGGLRSKQLFAFRAGDRVTLSFDLGGSQAGTAENFLASFEFDRVVRYTEVTRSGAYGSNAVGQGTGRELFQNSTVASDAPLRTYRYSFRALDDGQFRTVISTSSADGNGPLLDNVSVDVAALPEPATWMTMIGGLAMVGAAARRRRRVPAAA